MINKNELERSLYAIDIFAGAGGLGEGFYQAGFKILLSLDSDPYCCKTLRTRKLFRCLLERNRIDLYNGYVRGRIALWQIFNILPSLEKEYINDVVELELTEENVKIECNNIKYQLWYRGVSELDVLIGGPPCQAYSIAGRSRDGCRKINDRRHYLYRIYLNILQSLKPKIFLYENVPGLISAKSLDGSVIHHFVQDFNELDPSYVVLRPQNSQKGFFDGDEFSVDGVSEFILDSSDFGVPQRRRRFILIGVRRDLWKSNQEVFQRLWPSILNNKVNNKVTVKDAIGDLPALKANKGCDYYYGSRYAMNKPSNYALELRKGSVGVLNHRARFHMDSDLKRYIFYINAALKQGKNINLVKLADERPELLPNHRNMNSFLDRFKVQLPDRPATTITAHIAKDGHSYIHYDPEQCRTLTVREAARIQSFPDNYYFEGSRTQQFKQVGNAVPPIFAKIIAKEIKKSLKMLSA